MATPTLFLRTLRDSGITFAAGVPDSLLAPLTAEMESVFGADSHAIAANEGSAVAIAAGHHLATGRAALVYLQNSGLGNTVNPLVSLADPAVYGIPMLLVIGWRGEPGQHDEPQHRRQGELTLPLLELLDIPTFVLPADDDDVRVITGRVIESLHERSGPHAVVVRSGIFGPSRRATRSIVEGIVLRRAIEVVIDSIPDESVIVSTTGFTSRELAMLRIERGHDPGTDFLVVGSMGHAASIALGVALSRPDRLVWCLDGDGSLAMHMGTMALIGGRGPDNLCHVVFNNHVHDSVGGQPTVLATADLPLLARGAGYGDVLRCVDERELADALTRERQSGGARFLEVVTAPGPRPDLGRPGDDLVARKRAFSRRMQP